MQIKIKDSQPWNRDWTRIQQAILPDEQPSGGRQRSLARKQGILLATHLPSPLEALDRGFGRGPAAGRRRVPWFAHELGSGTYRYWTTMERRKLYVSEHGEDLSEVRN